MSVAMRGAIDAKANAVTPARMPAMTISHT
jgi:hypothetical protein